MKLLTHNMLTSKCLKNVTVGYPLKLVIVEKKISPSEFNEKMILTYLAKLNYRALVGAASAAGVELPEEIPDGFDKDFLKQLHHALFEVDILDGYLECPETGRKFPIKEGIPNMLCNEGEV